MRAIQVSIAGGPDRLELVEAPRPAPAPGQLLVRVNIAGVNFADTMLRRDAYFVPAVFPFVPGVEVAGVVEQIGPDVSAFEVGERVAGIRLDGGGGYADYALVDAANAAVVPASLDFARAVAVLNQGLTAQGLIESAPEIAKGASVLVTAAGGGVGGLLVQLARLGGAGAIVAAASRIEKLAFTAKDVTPVSYADPDWIRTARAAAGGRGVDLAIDAVGGEVRTALARLIVQRGRILYYGAASGQTGVTDAFLAQLMGKTASLTGYSIYTSISQDPAWLRRTLAGLFELAASGAIETPIHPAFPLERAAEAHAALEGRMTRGKVLLRID